MFFRYILESKKTKKQGGSKEKNHHIMGFPPKKAPLMGFSTVFPAVFGQFSGSFAVGSRYKYPTCVRIEAPCVACRGAIHGLNGQPGSPELAIQSNLQS